MQGVLLIDGWQLAQGGQAGIPSPQQVLGVPQAAPEQRVCSAQHPVRAHVAQGDVRVGCQLCPFLPAS